MAIGRPTKPLNLTTEEKEKVSLLARRVKSAQAVAMRARIVLGCSDGLSNGDVAKRLERCIAQGSFQRELSTGPRVEDNSTHNGEDKGSSNPPNGTEKATYTRDSETALDYADQRYNASTYGRFYGSNVMQLVNCFR